jgi:hypothetical protein
LGNESGKRRSGKRKLTYPKLLSIMPDPLGATLPPHPYRAHTDNTASGLYWVRTATARSRYHRYETLDICRVVTPTDEVWCAERK